MQNKENKIQSHLENAAREVFNKHMMNGGPSYRRYPDCWEVCNDLQETLLDSSEGQLERISDGEVGIEEIILSGEYYHYVLTVDGVFKTYVIDPTYGQFSEGFDSPINIAPQGEVEDVIVCEKHQYIFSDKFTQVI